jgi:hypothetical protein
MILALAAAAVALAAALYGWRGAVLGVTVVAFGVLLQFGHALRVMRRTAQAPVGRVADAAAAAARLRPGLRLVQVMQATGSLGEALSDQPEVFLWRDDAGAELRVSFIRGRVATWELARPSSPEAPATRSA